MLCFSVRVGGIKIMIGEVIPAPSPDQVLTEVLFEQNEESEFYNSQGFTKLGN